MALHLWFLPFPRAVWRAACVLWDVPVVPVVHVCRRCLDYPGGYCRCATQHHLHLQDGRGLRLLQHWRISLEGKIFLALLKIAIECHKLQKVAILNKKWPKIVFFLPKIANGIFFTIAIFENGKFLTKIMPNVILKCRHIWNWFCNYKIVYARVLHWAIKIY